MRIIQFLETNLLLNKTLNFKIFIKSHDISIADEIKNNPIFEKLLSNLTLNNEQKELILGRNTILQV